MERHTQTEVYWQQFQLSEEDLDRIYNYLLEATAPVPTSTLARMIIEGRMKEEERRLQEVLSRGKVYRPKEKYDVGDVVVFPALDYAVGTVVGMRQGHNPAYPEFQVIQVQLEGETKPREFASGLSVPHRLNENGDSQPTAGAGGLSVDEVFEKYGQYVIDVLERELSQRGDDFVYLKGGWFLRDSLADIHVGHLNIAEAVIDLRGEPLPVEEILPELELPEEIPEEIQRLSLEHALQHDERYVSVDVDGEIRWYLRRLLPEALATEPRLLRYDPIPYRRDDIPLALLQIEWELDDEWSISSEEPAGASLVPSATFVLIYPHWRYGTIPMTSRVRGILPEVKADLAQIHLVDGRWGERFVGWVSPQHRLIAGMNDWYQQHKIPVGSYIILERKVDEPNTYVIDFRPRRMKREWVRTARVEDDRLTFEMRKVEVACETDEHVLLSVADPKAVDRLVDALPDPLPPIQEDVDRVFPELAKLNPQGTVHAKTLYSAINVTRRCPPGPIFAVLATSERYQDMGDGYWAERLP